MRKYKHYGKDVEVKYQSSSRYYLDELGEYTILPIYGADDFLIAKYSKGYAVIERFGDMALLLEELPEDGDYYSLMRDVKGQMNGNAPKKMRSLFTMLLDDALCVAYKMVREKDITDEDMEYFERWKEKAKESNDDEANEGNAFCDDFLVDYKSEKIANQKLAQKIAARLLSRASWHEADLLFLAKNADDLMENDLNIIHEIFHWYEYQ